MAGGVVTSKKKLKVRDLDFVAGIAPLFKIVGTHGKRCLLCVLDVVLLTGKLFMSMS